MTREKTAEIIGLFSLTYPYSDLFKADSADELKRKQDALITVWASALPDVEDGIAGLAAQMCLRKYKFLPTIAEFLETADELESKQDSEALTAYLEARSALESYPEETAKKMMGPRAWTTIQAMGGIQAFQGETSYDLEGFKRTYRGMLRKMPETLPDKKLRELVGRG